MPHCSTCGIDLSSENFRAHYSSELHLANVRRRVKGEPPISERNWIRSEDMDDHRDPDGPPLFSCTLCKKTFRSVQTLQAHVRSTAHLVKKEQRIIAREGEGTILTTTTIGPAAMGLHRRHKAKLKKPIGKNQNEVKVSPEDREEDAGTTRCLFCGHPSETFHDNMRHMKLVHDFYIPMVEFCSDKEGFIAYLSRKVNGLVCLVCNEKSKIYHSLQALRDHMRECGHEKVVLSSEYRDFYNCTLDNGENSMKLGTMKGNQLTVNGDGQKKRILKKETNVPRPRHKEKEEVLEQRKALTANANSAALAAKEEHQRIMAEHDGAVRRMIARAEGQYHSQQLKVGLRTNKLHPKGYDGEG